MIVNQQLCGLPDDRFGTRFQTLGSSVYSYLLYGLETNGRSLVQRPLLERTANNFGVRQLKKIFKAQDAQILHCGTRFRFHSKLDKDAT